MSCGLPNYTDDRDKCNNSIPTNTRENGCMCLHLMVFREPLPHCNARSYYKCSFLLHQTYIEIVCLSQCSPAPLTTRLHTTLTYTFRGTIHKHTGFNYVKYRYWLAYLGKGLLLLCKLSTASRWQPVASPAIAGVHCGPGKSLILGQATSESSRAPEPRVQARALGLFPPTTHDDLFKKDPEVVTILLARLSGCKKTAWPQSLMSDY